MTKRIPREDLDKAWRSLLRRAASSLVYAMAEADADFAFIAKKTGQKEKDVRKFLLSLIECTVDPDTDDALSKMSYIATACGGRLELRLERLETDEVVRIPVDLDGEDDEEELT